MLFEPHPNLRGARQFYHTPYVPQSQRDVGDHYRQGVRDRRNRRDLGKPRRRSGAQFEVRRVGPPLSVPGSIMFSDGANEAWERRWALGPEW